MLGRATEAMILATYRKPGKSFDSPRVLHKNQNISFKNTTHMKTPDPMLVPSLRAENVK